MKKTILTIIGILIIYTSTAQDQPTLYKRDTQKNDLSINIHYFAIIEGININYDRVFNKDISIGLSIFKAYDNANSIDSNNINLTTSTNFIAIPNIKYFVGNRFARRFYVQGLLMISSGKANIFVNTNSFSEEVDFTDIALGIGIGDKRVLKNGIFIDFGIAIAYNILTKNSPNSFVHPNFSVGYRF